MHLSPSLRSQPSPELQLQPASLSPPKAQALKFFRTFSTRPVSASNVNGLAPWETSPRAAARALRGWFGSPPSPRSSKTEEQEEYRWRYLDDGEEWEEFLSSVEDEGGSGGPLPKSPGASLRRVEEENSERRRRRTRRSESKSGDWDAAMLAHARSLGYSCPSSPSNLGSNGSVESLASGSSGSSPAHVHTPPMSVFSPSIRVAAHYRPMRDRTSSYSGGKRGTKRPPLASEDVVARYFAGVGPAEGSMLEGFGRGPRPEAMGGPRRNEAHSPEQQNALRLEVEARDPCCPSSLAAPPRTRSPTPHRGFRPSPLVGRRSPSSVDGEDNNRREDRLTDVETPRVWNHKRRRNTTDGLTTIWETAIGNHRVS